MHTAKEPENRLKIVTELLRLQEEGLSLHVVGGTVRDLLLTRQPADLDLVVQSAPRQVAKQLLARLGEGALVPLSDTPGEEAARLVWRGEQLDFAAWRSGADSLEADLLLRDFTINAMALPVAALGEPVAEEALIDPAGGAADLAAGLLRALPGSFAADPLRMVRAFRFHAKLDFTLTEATLQGVAEHAAAINRVAAERISYELRQIFEAPRTAATIQLMAAGGLLRHLLPELYLGDGVTQPEEFHHLNVLEHGLCALTMAEKIIHAPEQFLGEKELLAGVKEWLARPGNPRRAKWAALLHDLGKPGTKSEAAGRTTFYGHDHLSVKLFEEYARRSRWSGADSGRVATLIGQHMNPFHLVDACSRGQLSRRGILRFTRRSGEELFGLLVVSLADVLAGNPKHHEAMQRQLLEFYAEVARVWREEILPVTTAPPLLGGRDLIALGLTPGPLFSRLLTALEEAQVEGEVNDVAAARAFARRFAAQERDSEAEPCER